MSRPIVAAGVLSLLLATMLVLTTSDARFVGTTANDGNDFEAATVAVGDNDSGSTMLSATALLPGDSTETCVRVDYTGTVSAEVRLHGTASGGLPASLNLTVERGSGAAGYGDCTGFSLTATVYSGTVSGLAATHTDYGSGAGAYTASPGTSAWFRIRWTLQDVNAAQGQSASATYTWEAHSGGSSTNFRATTGSSTVTVPAGVLQPPGTPTATYGCTLTVRRITVAWTATPTTWATTYRLYRSVNGAAYAEVATVTYGTNSWVDNAVNGSTSYAYKLRAERSGWTWVSTDTAPSNTVATPALCV